MEVPKEDRIHVLHAKVNHSLLAKILTNVNFVNSVVCAFCLGLSLPIAFGPHYIFTVLGSLLSAGFVTVMFFTWPFKVTCEDWLMWKATKAEA